MALLKFRPSIASSTIAMVHFGFTPIENGLIGSVNIDKIGIDSLDRDILLLLNQNARLSYSTIAKSLKQEVETVRYRIRGLKKKNLISKFTIVLERPPTEYNIAFYINYELAPGLPERYKEAYDYYLNFDSRLPVINTYQYLALTTGSFLLYGIGCFESEEKAIKDMVMAHRQIYMEDNPKISYAKITHVIKGFLPIRNIDIGKEFNVIKWM
jgi:DNA-binding Lrp family transcriptional regulator